MAVNNKLKLMDLADLIHQRQPSQRGQHGGHPDDVFQELQALAHTSGQTLAIDRLVHHDVIANPRRLCFDRDEIFWPQQNGSADFAFSFG